MHLLQEYFLEIWPFDDANSMSQAKFKCLQLANLNAHPLRKCIQFCSKKQDNFREGSFLERGHFPKNIFYTIKLPFIIQVK